MTLLIVFILSYTLGALSALTLIGLTLAGRDRAPGRRMIQHDA